MSSRRLHHAALALLLTSLPLACAWDPWIPGEGGRKPEPVVNPANMSLDIPIGEAYFGDLDCFARQCQQRFRLLADRPGRLTVTAEPEIRSADQGARLVLEAVRGVLDRDSTQLDSPPLEVTAFVQRGTYFVLLQSIGGRMAYTITPKLRSDVIDVTADPRSLETTPPMAPIGREPAPEPPPRLSKIDINRFAGAAYDPQAIFSSYSTFAFPPLPRGPDLPPGTPVEQPRDRQIRRFLAESLALKGLTQVDEEDADLLFGFSTGNQTKTWFGYFFPILYSGYATSGYAVGPHVYTRGGLVIDVVDPRSERLVWHAWTTKGLGPGITPGDATTALLREAVDDVLSEFPPN